MSVPAIPDASILTPANVASFGADLVAWAEQETDVRMVKQMADKWAAITEYVKRTSRDGVAEAESALRRLEIRVGELLDREVGGRGRKASAADDGLTSRDLRHDFRTMAEHPDIVEDVIAASTDADPPSRAKVLRAIKQSKADAEWSKAKAEDGQWAADLRETAGATAESLANDRKRQQIRMDIRDVTDAVDHLARWTPDEVAWALETDFEHIRRDLTSRLDRALTVLEERVA